MYNNPYIRQYNNMNQQTMYEQIDNQINQLQQMREQIKTNANQQPAINQTFQLAPSGTNTMKYANTIDDVNKEIIFGDTPFFSRDMTVLWIKNTKGNIKSYELNEIIPKDTKDMQIEYLQAQIEELKGMIKNEQFNSNDFTEQNATGTAKYDDTNGTTIEKAEPTSVSKVSRSKKEQ